MSLSFELPTEFLEQVAQRAAEIVLAQLDHRPAEPWPEWLSVETVARYLDFPVERVRKLVAARRIPFHQEGVGCRVSFKRPEIDEWMDKQRVEARRS